MPTIIAATAKNVLQSILRDGPALQLIDGLTVTPGPNSVSFTFQTRFASSALIEIFKYTSSDHTKDIVAGNLITSNESQLVGVARKKKHNYRLPQPANWTPTSFPGFDDPILAPLEQDTHYWFRVTADSAISDVTAAVTIGRLWTGKRDASVTLPELIVYQYGSSDLGNDVDSAINSAASLFGLNPPNPSDYHLDLEVGLYDQVVGLVDQTEKSFTSQNNSDDLQDPFPGVTLQCPGAHDFLWMYSYGLGNQSAWSLGAFGGTDSFATTPPDVAQSGNNGGPFSEAVTISPRLPDSQPDETTPIQIFLESVPGGTSYELSVWIKVIVTAPRHAPVIYTSPFNSLAANLTHIDIKKLKLHSTPKLTGDSEGALAFGNPEKLHVIVPAAKGALWSQTIEPASPKRAINNPWYKLASSINTPIAVLVNEDGTVDLVGRGTNGNAWHTKWNGVASSADKIKWHDLDRAMNEQIALVRKGKALDIFMLSDEGEILHGHLLDEAKAPVWKSLGGKVSTELKAALLADNEIYLFGLGEDGNVWHSTHSASGKTVSGKSAWSSLGSSANIQLSVLSDEKAGIVLFAINKERTVSRKAWNGKAWSPSADEWTELGNIDALSGAP